MPARCSTGRTWPLSKPHAVPVDSAGGILALGVITLVLLESRLRVSYRTPLSGCAHDNGTGGGAGVYRWAERIGIPVRLLDAPISEASRSLPSPRGTAS